MTPNPPARGHSADSIGDALVLALATAVSVAILGMNDPRLDIAALTGLGAFIIRRAGLNLGHPAVWLPAGILLYAVPYRVLLQLEPQRDLARVGAEEALHRAAYLEVVALAASAAGIHLALGIGRSARARLRRRPLSPDPLVPAVAILGVALALNALSLVDLVQSGSTTKQSLALQGSAGTLLLFAYLVTTAMFALLLVRYSDQGRFPYWLVTLGLAWTLLAFLVSGERDLLLRVAIVAVVVLHLAHRALRPPVLIAGMLVLLILLPILGANKMLLTRGDGPSADRQSLAYEVLGTELAAASRNLQRLLADEDQADTDLGIDGARWAVERLLSTPWAGTRASSTGWFNERFHPGVFAAGGGRGFSLIGEGYASFGAPGVAASLALLGFTAGAIYRRAHRSSYWLAGYACFVPLAVYALRADWSTVTAQGVRYILLPIAACWGAAAAIRRVARTRPPRLAPLSPSHDVLDAPSETAGAVRP